MNLCHFGGRNGATVRGSTIDSNGNITFVGYGSAFSMPFSFDAANVFLDEDLNNSNAFVVKYNNDGEVIFSYFTSWVSNNQFISVFSDDNDIYASGQFR